MAEQVTRRNPEMERYVEIKSVVSDGIEAHHVLLKVANQQFCVTPGGLDKEEAEFLRDMLCIALARLVAEQCAS